VDRSNIRTTHPPHPQRSPQRGQHPQRKSRRHREARATPHCPHPPPNRAGHTSSQGAIRSLRTQQRAWADPTPTRRVPAPPEGGAVLTPAKLDSAYWSVFHP